MAASFLAGPLDCRSTTERIQDTFKGDDKRCDIRNNVLSIHYTDARY